MVRPGFLNKGFKTASKNISTDFDQAPIGQAEQFQSWRTR